MISKLNGSTPSPPINPSPLPTGWNADVEVASEAVTLDHRWKLRVEDGGATRQKAKFLHHETLKSAVVYLSLTVL